MPKYNAFISYTHNSEMQVASALDDALTRFAKPWNKLRAQRIYRDTDSQALTPNLLKAVHRAMENSEYLILMASPESAQSNWVPEEIAHWVAQKPLENLLIVVRDGEVVWDHNKTDFDWDRTNCLPGTLRGVYEGEPLYLDLRWTKEDSDLSLENHKFKDAVARLSATLSGKSLDEMFSDEVVQFRRTIRIRNSAIAALSILTVSACIAAFIAFEARNEAELQRQQAVAAQQVAEQRQLRSEGAELRAMLQRLSALLEQAENSGDERNRSQLQAEYDEINTRLTEVSTQHQTKLAEAMGFRGDLEFLLKYESRAGNVTWSGHDVLIDPQTYLGSETRETIRERYSFLLSPAELQAVLRITGLRGDDARAAYDAEPVLRRIHLAPADVRRLVPAVAESRWRHLMETYPILADANTPVEVHTVILSIAFNMGTNRIKKDMAEDLNQQNWLSLADTIESYTDERIYRQFPALVKRRRDEANLLRSIIQ